MLYFILRYIARYRLSVVRTNIENSFPDKTPQEQKEIINEYYRFMVKLFHESIATLFISKHKIKNRFIYTNPELLQQIADEGQNSLILFGHYGNWERMGSFPLWISGVRVGAIYKRLYNKHTDALYQRIRSRFGVICIEKKETLRTLIKWSRGNERFILGVLADQVPTRQNIHYWLKFLNQPTSVISGWAAIARKLNLAVGYMDVKPDGRGRYLVTTELITRTPGAMSEKQLVEAYFSRLEKTILSHPSYWLWSHRRWKHTPPENIEELIK